VTLLVHQTAASIVSATSAWSSVRLLRRRIASRRSEAAHLTTQMSRKGLMIHVGETAFPPKWVQIKDRLRLTHASVQSRWIAPNDARGITGTFTEKVARTAFAFWRMRLPDGRGVRLNMDGTFKGFMD
jgi:hypothetical protein